MLHKCLKCEELGHRLSDYRLKNLNLVMAKVSEVEVNDIEDKDNEKALELEADEGEFLKCIIQKNLLAPKFKEDTQRNKIFTTNGTINDKVCNMINDNNNNENIVSKALVDVTRLSTQNTVDKERDRNVSDGSVSCSFLH